MAKRRVNGEGSWGERTINGTHYVYYKDPTGKFFYGKTHGEVEEKRKKQPKSIKVTDKLTFGEYVKKWLYEQKYQEVGINLQPTTFDTYEDSLSVRFFQNPISNVQMMSLDTKKINNYLKGLSQKYRRGSIQKTWMVLKMALQDTDAAGYDQIQNINFSKISIPSESNMTVKKKVVNYTTQEDMDKLYQEAFRKTSRGTEVYNDASKLLVFIMYSGLRVAEGCGLKWKNVNLEEETITVVTQTTIIKDRDNNGVGSGYKIIDKSPKTEPSIRTIPYLERAGIVLKLMYDKHPHNPTDYVFITQNGKPYTRRLVEKTLERMLKNANCSTTEYTVHSLRHGYGSILYQNNVDLKTISKLLGHSDITTTANIYVDVGQTTLKEAIQKVNNKFK